MQAILWLHKYNMSRFAQKDIRATNIAQSVHVLHNTFDAMDAEQHGGVVVSQRTVISWRNNKTVKHWVIEPSDLEEIDGVQFLMLNHSNRGFASFANANLSSSAPLKGYTWLDSFKALRNQSVDALLDAAAHDTDPSHVAGKKTMRHKYANSIPKTCVVKVPAVEHDGVTAGPLNVTVVSETNPMKNCSLESTSANLHYVRIAMQADKPDGTAELVPRARPKHSEYLRTRTGVSGVVKKGTRISASYEHDGKRKAVTTKGVQNATGLADACRALKKKCVDIANDGELDDCDIGSGGECVADDSDDEKPCSLLYRDAATSVASTSPYTAAPVPSSSSTTPKWRD